MIQQLLKLINKAGYHLQQAEQAQAHGLEEVHTYNMRKYERDMVKIRVIRKILGA